MPKTSLSMMKGLLSQGFKKEWMKYHRHNNKNQCFWSYRRMFLGISQPLAYSCTTGLFKWSRNGSHLAPFCLFSVCPSSILVTCSCCWFHLLLLSGCLTWAAILAFIAWHLPHLSMPWVPLSNYSRCSMWGFSFWAAASSEIFIFTLFCVQLGSISNLFKANSFVAMKLKITTWIKWPQFDEYRAK